MRFIVVLLFALLSFGAHAASCGGPRHVAQLAIIGAGPLVEQIHVEHQRIYGEAAARVRASLSADAGTLADYDRLMLPVNAEFDRRGMIIASLSTAIYGGAAIVDAAKSGRPEDYAAAAAAVLSQIEAAERELQREGPLAPIQIPPTALTVTAALRSIAGTLSHQDAGQGE